MTASFRAAMAMLTRLPLAPANRATAGARAFGLVGALVGLVGAVPLVGLGAFMAPVGAILAIGAVAVVSGALHLDGLADTADALVAGGAEASERARKDPSIGPGGAVALILVMGLQIVATVLLIERSGALQAGLACVVGCAGSRVAPVIVARATASKARQGGLAAWFEQQSTGWDAVLAASSAAGVAVLAGILAGSQALVAGGVLGFAIGMGLSLGVIRLRGQLDGDGLGAAVELTFAASLVSTAAIVRWPVA
jgi:adenosylcobinamide-GDP ribazoletransferase